MRTSEVGSLSYGRCLAPMSVISQMERLGEEQNVLLGLRSVLALLPASPDIGARQRRRTKTPTSLVLIEIPPLNCRRLAHVSTCL